MAIDTEAICQIADEQLASGGKVSVDSVQKALKKKYDSGGNRNKVTAVLAKWRKERGIGTGKSTAKAAVAVDNPNSFIGRFPDAIRQAVISLIVAIHALIGSIRSEERGAATELVDNAQSELKAELDTAHEAIRSLRVENNQLKRDIKRREGKTAQKSGEASTGNAAELLKIMSEFIRSGAGTENNPIDKAGTD